jgi:hypothetical protein
MNNENLKTLVIAGIDYSITSPAIVISKINDERWTHTKTKAFYFDSRKNAPSNPQCEIQLDRQIYPLWLSAEQRYEQLALWAVSILIAEQVDIVYLEGYALSRSSASGLVFNIAENGGVLKQNMYLCNIKFVEVSPTALKTWVVEGKRGDHKGHADKELMEKCFVIDTNITNLREILGLTEKASSPIGDIIDAYFLCKFGYIDKTVGIVLPEKKKKKMKLKPLPPIKPFKPGKKYD